MDFTAIQPINLCDTCGSNPVWEFRDEGKEIWQGINSNAGIAVGNIALSAVEFEGTIYVNNSVDNDFVGSVFSFQVKRISCWRFTHYKV